MSALLKKVIREGVEKRWYGTPGVLRLLSPLESLFAALAKKRRKSQTDQAVKVSAPVIVVGNISVGGTGKTPVITALVKLLQKSGYKPGVISRGYGRNSTKSCLLVSSSVVAQECGDEPALIYQQTGCPVVVDEDRVKAAQFLLNTQACDIILTDDGLQHYRLQRDIEIAVVDGGRLFGNEHLLPVGPLREAKSRLNEVDWVLVNVPSSIENLPPLEIKTEQYQVYIQPVSISHVKTGRRLPIGHLKEMEDLQAMVGLGNPEKFFATLDALDLTYTKHVFPDHHNYIESEFTLFEGRSVIMTDKDAVKCDGFASDTMYSLNVELALPHEFSEAFLEKVQTLTFENENKASHQ